VSPPAQSSVRISSHAAAPDVRTVDTFFAVVWLWLIKGLGLLIGVLFFLPLVGLAVGTATGAAVGFMSDVGIDPDFIGEIRRKVVPGTSALFLLTEHAVVDRVVPELRSLQPELIITNLPAEQEARLRELFAEDPE
jgi:uncharacterized membrane protein